jgi:hypothetical protein
MSSEEIMKSENENNQRENGGASKWRIYSIHLMTNEEVFS